MLRQELIIMPRTVPFCRGTGLDSIGKVKSDRTNLFIKHINEVNSAFNSGDTLDWKETATRKSDS